jgi:DNA-binding NarL/FixJ family response regulator
MNKHDNQPTSQPTNTISFEEACRHYFTDTEIRILKFVVEGFTCKEIAAKLGNKPSTIQTHRKKIKRKLNLTGPRSLERWCHKYGGDIRQYSI